MTAPPPQWGPPPTAPQWGPPPTTPSWGPPTGLGPEPYRAPPAASRSVLGTVFAHLVLWLGLLLVALGYRYLVRYVLVHLQDIPYQVLNGAVDALTLLPVLVALVIAGRGTVPRLAALLGAVALLAGSVTLTVVRFPGYVYPFAAALAVLGLGTWIAVRRHARIGLLVLIPAAVLAVVWFGPIGSDLRQFPYDHGYGTFRLLLWSNLIVVALAVLGLVSSLLRPRPEPGRDGVTVAVVGGLVGVALVTGVVAAVT